jgi:hypothetical protein
MVMYRDASFVAYHWHIKDVDKASGLQGTVLNLAFSESQEVRRAAFLELLHSNDPAAQGIAMDQYTYNQTLRRWGIDNEFKLYEGEIVEAARALLLIPPVTAMEWNTGNDLVGANYASALHVLWFLGNEADCGLIEPILRTATHPEVLRIACNTLSTCLEGSQTLYPEILQDLQHLIFEVDLSNAELLEISQTAIYSLRGYKLKEVESILLEALQHENCTISAHAAEVLHQWNLPQYCDQIQAVMTNWPEDSSYLMRNVKEEIEIYLNPPEPEPELTEEEERQLEEEKREAAERRRRSRIKERKERNLDWHYNGGYKLYFWKELMDVYVPFRDKETAHLISRVSRVLTNFDGEEDVSKIQQLLQSDLLPARCCALDIFAFHQFLGRYGYKNPFEEYAIELLAEARLQLKALPVASAAYYAPEANHASALLVLKYLGDISDLPAIEAIIQSSQDINVLCQAWQAVRHCSGQPNALYPELIKIAESVLLKMGAISILQQDVISLFSDYHVDEVEQVLLRIIKDEYEFPLGSDLKIDAAWTLLSWDVSKYVEVVRELIEYYSPVKEEQCFALSEAQNIIEKYDQEQLAQAAGIKLGRG